MNDDPCGAGPTRWRARRAYAYADGSHEPAPGAGCSAGRSACPWPRLYLLVVWRLLSGVHACAAPQTNRPLVVSSGLARNRRCPDTPVAAVSPTYGRLFEGTDLTSPGQTALSCGESPHESPAVTAVTHRSLRRYTFVTAMLQNGWHPPRKLLASAKAVSDRSGAQSPSGGTGRRVVHTTPNCGDTCRPATSRRYASRRADCPVHTCG